MSDSDPADHDEWEAQAAALQDHGIPPQRANVVALRDAGHTFSEIAAELEFGADGEDRSQVSYHLDAYREQRHDAEWLVKHAPDLG